MPPERFAAIDVGTNTVLLTVAERRGGAFEPVVERAEITRLGQGVDRTGQLSEEAIARTVAVLEAYAGEARSLGVTRFAAVATSAARDAMNGERFFAAARREAGLEVEVLSGGEEARLIHASAWRDFGGPGGLAVVDVGGGSTEFTLGEGPEPRFRRSMDVGAVRLTERLVEHDPPTRSELQRMTSLAREALAALQGLEGTGGSGARLVGVAGTVTTLCAVAQGLPRHDARRVHGATLSRDELVRLRDRLAALPAAERARVPGMEPKRADVIVGGAIVLVEAMVATGFERLTVSDRGVRWGLLYDRFGEK